MTTVYPKLITTSCADAPLGKVTYLRVRNEIQCGLVVAIDNKNKFLKLSAGSNQFCVQEIFENNQVVFIDCDTRLFLDTSQISRMEGMYQESSRGFVLAQDNGPEVLVCAVYDGFGYENALLELSSWTISNERTEYRIGTQEWNIELRDRDANQWLPLKIPSGEEVP